MPRLRVAEPPRLLRSVSIQAAGLCAAALLASVPWISRHAPKEPAPAPKPVEPKKEQRIRVIRIPRPEVVRTETPRPQPPAPKPPPPKEPQRAEPKPPLPNPPPKVMQAAARPEPKVIQAAARPEPAPPRPIAQVAPDVKAVKGVPLHIYVPSSPEELAAHLRHSGGCLVVSNLSGDDQGVLKVFGIEGSRAVEVSEMPCSGAPRRLSPTLNAALGDPVGRVRAELGHGDLALQVYLSPDLYDRAQTALVARFGPVSQEEMAQKASDAGYELSCFADPNGPVRCQ
ncbi:MAG: hypothetical protein ACJ79Y_05370 [Myxococcales bacterium]